MARRIPESFISELLARANLVELIDHRVPLKRAGSNYVACCPFHKEKSPSFSVSPIENFYYCFGCHASGNAIGFLMEYDRLEFTQAVKSLADDLGLKVPEEADDTPQDNHAPLYDMLARAADVYKELLAAAPGNRAAVNYCKKRGVTGHAARDFALGWAPNAWDTLVGRLGTTASERRLLIEAGLAREKEGRLFDLFRNRVMFPIRDSRGRVIAFGGRVLGDEKPKYLNSPDTPVFHKGRELYGLFEARRSRTKFSRFLVVEGYLDVIALAQHGLPYATATLGTATSTEHLEKLYRQAPEVVFCFDGDEAGRKAAWRALEAALPVLKDGRQASFLFLPEGEDPDSLVRQEGQALFEARISAEARPLPDWFFAALQERFPLRSLDSKARYAREAVAYLNKLPEGMLHTLMLEQLSTLTGLAVDQLQNAMDDLQSATTIARRPAFREQQSPDFAAPATDRYRADRHNRDAHTRDDYHHHDYGYDASPGPGKKWDPARRLRKRAQETLTTRMEVPLTDAIVRLLLLTPAQARDVDMALLDGLDLPGTDLLAEMVQWCREHERVDLASLLGHWHGTDLGQHLARLAAQTWLLDGEQLPLTFQHAMTRLEMARLEQDITALNQALQSAPSAELIAVLTSLKNREIELRKATPPGKS